ARAGIYMPANPHPGESGLQEYYRGQAEDHYRVKDLAATVRTPAASSARALLTEEWTPLEPGVLDHKLYVRGIGTVLEQTVRGGDERNTLVSIRRGSPKRLPRLPTDGPRGVRGLFACPCPSAPCSPMPTRMPASPRLLAPSRPGQGSGRSCRRACGPTCSRRSSMPSPSAPRSWSRATTA